MKVIVITSFAPSNINELITIEKEDFIISVDSATTVALEQDIKIDLAIGDFDSITDLSVLDNIKTIKLAPEKDETDTFMAVKYAYENIGENIFILGGIKGDRIEHFIANIYMFKYFPTIKIMNHNSTIELLKVGRYKVSYKGYLSFFAFSNALLTLKGFKYPLNSYNLELYDPLCISNELAEEVGLIEVTKGSVILIKSIKK